MTCSRLAVALSLVATLLAVSPARGQEPAPAPANDLAPRDAQAPAKKDAPPAPAQAAPAAPAPAAEKAPDQPVVGGDAAANAKAAAEIVDPYDAYKKRLGKLIPVWTEGYVVPSFAFQYRPDPPAPRFRLDYGFGLGAGVIFRSNPFPHWRGVFNLGFNFQALRVGTIPTPVDSNGDGIPDTFVYQVKDIDTISIVEGTVTFEPFQWLALKAGVMPLPYTIDNGDAGTFGLFRNRTPTNDVFLNGPDVGAMALTRFAGRVRIQGGVVNGKSLGLGPDPLILEVRGPTFTFRADLEPWGIFGFGEGDPNFGPFKLGLGFGALWRPGTYYDAGTGYEVATVNDTRVSGSVQLAYAFFDVRAEYVRAMITDTLSSRPAVHDGAYAMARYYWKLNGFAVQPVVRGGYTTLNLLVEPRTVGWIETGMGLYPRSGQPRPDALKIWAFYQGERRFTEAESAHGMKMGIDLLF